MKYIDNAHQARANEISLMFFNGNFRVRPSKKSVFNFSAVLNSRAKILAFLSDVNEQKKYK